MALARRSKKTICRVTVVLAAFVDDPYVAPRLRLLIMNDSIQLRDLKRGLVTFVINAYCEGDL